MQVSAIMQLCECLILGKGKLKGFYSCSAVIVFEVGDCFFLGRGRGCCGGGVCLFGFVGLII